MPTTTLCMAGRSRTPAPSGTSSGTSAGVIGDKGAPLIADGDKMPGARFFPDARLNFAENLLRRRDAGDALVFRGEDKVRRRLSWAELQRPRLAPAAGVPRPRRRRRRPRRGDAAQHAGDDRRHARDRVARRDLVVLLARFRRARRARPLRPDRAEAVHRLRRLLLRRQGASTSPTSSPRSCRGLPSVAQVDRRPLSRRGGRQSPPRSPMRVDLDAAASRLTRRGRSSFARLPFDHPLYILFSSGTTGVPKCIVHRAGGTLLQHLKEHRLHSRHRAGRPRLLLHHLRLDDVELAGHRRSPAGDAAALRRLALPSRAGASLRLRRRREA